MCVRVWLYMIICVNHLQNCLEFSTNIDITKYQDGKRETYNPEGQAHASIVWDFYQVNCWV